MDARATPPQETLRRVARECGVNGIHLARIHGRRWHCVATDSAAPAPDGLPERLPLSPEWGAIVYSASPLDDGKRAAIRAAIGPLAGGDAPLPFERILAWLREEDPARLEALWAEADAVRRRHVGDAVHLRGLIEVSNHCVRRCGYCGIRADRADLRRYRMTPDEILGCAHEAVRLGYGTVVLQAGEDPGLTDDFIADSVRRIKGETPLAVTLSLGEREERELALWKEAGADRYLLRFETSDPALFARIHPPRAGQPCDRLALLRAMRAMGYEIGSGVMIGIPGQTYAGLARDVELFRALDLDMIGAGPYIPHPATPLAAAAPAPDGEQAPATEGMTYKVVALARLVCPEANIPSTTALATINRQSGRELGLARGANIVMPNLTPVRYRAMYEIYPAKACIAETAEACNGCLRARIASIGRHVGAGPGGRRRSDA